MTPYPLWKYIIIVLVCATGLFYAFPNLFGDDPGIQMRGARGLSIEARPATAEEVDGREPATD